MRRSPGGDAPTLRRAGRIEGCTTSSSWSRSGPTSARRSSPATGSTAKVEGLRGYRCYPACPGQDAPFDAVAVLSFDDADAAERALATEEFANALADAPNFQDTETTTSFTAEERTIV